VGKKYNLHRVTKSVKDGDVVSGICRIQVADRRLWYGGSRSR